MQIADSVTFRDALQLGSAAFLALASFILRATWTEVRELRAEHGRLAERVARIEGSNA